MSTHPQMRRLGLTGSIQANVLRLYGEQRTVEQIARALELDERAVYFHLDNVALGGRAPAAGAEGRRRFLRERSRSEREELAELIAELWNGGRSVEGIAMETGKSVRAIQKRLERMRRAGVKLAAPFHRLWNSKHGHGDGVVSARAAHAVYGVTCRDVKPRYHLTKTLAGNHDDQGGAYA
jgi:hypothetical protein